MKLRTLGDTDLTVSELCLGTLQFGWKTTEATSVAILDAFWASGGTFIQASSSLADEHDRELFGLAASETHVGRWLTSRHLPRASMVLATRVVMPAGAGDSAVTPLEQRLRHSCETSLRRLGTDYLDLLLCEWGPLCLPVERLFAAMTSLAESGVVRHFGVSGFPAWRIMQTIGRGHDGGRLPMAVVQDDLSLVARAPFQPDLAELCQDQRLSFLARSPLGGGFLGGIDRRARRSGREKQENNRFAHADGMRMRKKLESLAHRRGATATQTALSWVLAQPTVAAAVIGVSAPQQLPDLIRATAAPLNGEELAELDRWESADRPATTQDNRFMNTLTA